MGTLNVFKLGYDPIHKHPLNIFRNIRQFFRNIKWAWQRATRGYSDWDLWDLDMFYLDLLINSLRDFKAHTLSCPEKDDVQTLEDWQNVLESMILHFEHARDYEEIYPNPYEDKYFNKLINIVSGYVDGKQKVRVEIEPRSKEEQEIYHKRKIEFIKNQQRFREKNLQRGFELLNKWFNHLWW